MKYTKELVEVAVKSSKTKRECLKKLGMFKGAYSQLDKYIKKYEIDTSSLLSMSEITKMHAPCNKKFELNSILKENSSYPTGTLKERLYKSGLKKRECEECKQGEEWRGKRMALILDHINGINNDHRLENLRILCSNCNATTDTFCRGINKIKNGDRNR